MTRRQRILWLVVAVALTGLVAACITYKQPKAERVDRGIRANHPIHAEQGLECDICHQPADDGTYSFPTHDTCSVCHDIDTDNPTPEACGKCHTNESFEITEFKSPLGPDIKFTHEPHIAKKVECKTCHAEPDTKPFPSQPLMPFCMDCHGKTSPALNECSVCHKETNKQTIPSSRNGVNISHNQPAIWMKVHGAESKVDPKFCAMCHTDQAFCDSCHATTPPENHTVTWRRKTHGMQASWDRNTCSVCHEEDSCLKCHKNTQPESHRQAWGPPANHHCVSCHFPPTKTDCVVCHETIEHPSALPSPHRVMVYPVQCGVCHPGRQAGRAPHPENSTVNCRFCH